MPSNRVKVLVDPAANHETICDEILSAAQAGAPTGSPFPADIIRDGNGKVVQVIVNLPDSDAPGLANATAKINENSGVATAIAFPFIVADNDLDSYTPDAAILPTTGSIFNIVDPVSGGILRAQPTNLYGATAAESVGGSGSAFRMQDMGAASGKTSKVNMSAHASDNSLSIIKSYQARCSMKLDNTGASLGTTNFLQFTIGETMRLFPTDPGAYSSNPAAAGLMWSVQNVFTGVTVDTAILLTDFITVDVSMNETGDPTVLINGSPEVTLNGNFPFYAPAASKQLLQTNDFRSQGAGASEQNAMICDDIYFQVNS